VPTNVPLMSVGLDSLALVILTQSIQEQLSIPLLPGEVLEHPSIDDLSDYLIDKLSNTIDGVDGASSFSSMDTN